MRRGSTIERPMLVSGRPLRRMLLSIALVCGLVAALMPPASYFFIKLSYDKEELEFETRGAADRISSFALSQRSLEPAHQANLSRLITLPELEARGYARRVVDLQRRVLIERGKAEGLFVIRESAPILMNGQTVGSVEFALDLDGYLWNTLWFALIGLMFGALVFAGVYSLPIRALDRTLFALQAQISATSTPSAIRRSGDLHAPSCLLE